MFEGNGFLKLEVDPKAMSLQDAACSMKLAPAKFTARDETPVEIHKLRIFENISNMGKNDMVYIMQPRDLSDSRYELKIDDKNKTATITLTQNYHIQLNQDVHDGVFYENNGGQKVGTAGYSYQITVTGLGSGNPQIASVGFGQEITACDF